MKDLEVMVLSIELSWQKKVQLKIGDLFSHNIKHVFLSPVTCNNLVFSRDFRSQVPALSGAMVELCHEQPEDPVTRINPRVTFLNEKTQGFSGWFNASFWKIPAFVKDFFRLTRSKYHL